MTKTTGKTDSPEKHRHFACWANEADAFHTRIPIFFNATRLWAKYIKYRYLSGWSADKGESRRIFQRLSEHLGHEIEDLPNLPTNNFFEYLTDEDRFSCRPCENGDYLIGCCRFTKPQADRLWRVMATRYDYEIEE